VKLFQQQIKYLLVLLERVHRRCWPEDNLNFLAASEARAESADELWLFKLSVVDGNIVLQFVELNREAE
jgi:hypothetical protein